VAARALAPGKSTGASPAESAAWSCWRGVLLNLDEFITVNDHALHLPPSPMNAA